MAKDEGAGVLEEALARRHDLPRLGSPADLLPAGRSSLGRGSDCGVDRWHVEEAERLHGAELSRRPEALLSRRRPGLLLEDAYRVQWCGAALRVDDGARIIGHKVGLTSQAMQDQFCIDEPDSGILLDSMRLGSGEALRVTDLLSPRVEAELAFRIGTDLDGSSVTEDDVRRAVAEVLLALEVIDSRYGLQGLTLEDSVADNAACARIVLGDAVPMPQWDLRAERLTVRQDGAAVASGEGRDILGDPIRSVVWLTRRLAAFGTGLKAGELVLAGAVHASIPLLPGHTVSVSSPRLPPVSLHAT